MINTTNIHIISTKRPSAVPVFCPEGESFLVKKFLPCSEKKIMGEVDVIEASSSGLTV
jgi:hypothetical protein